MAKLIHASAIRKSALSAALIAMLVSGGASTAAAQGGPVGAQRDARQHGLKRAWFTQVQLDRGRSRVAGVTLDGNALFIQTTAGALHAIDSETGRTLWTAQVGSPRHPSLVPAANDKWVASINGSRLYVFDRNTGAAIWDRSLGGSPGAGPGVTATKVYVPLINGQIEGYKLDPDRSSEPPWSYKAAGRALVQPVAIGDSVCWPTDAGHFYVARGDNVGIRFRLETSDDVVCPPAYSAPHFFCASLDGYVYAVNELSGNQIWRFSTGDPIITSPVAIADRVYALPERGGMYCLDAKTGKELWWTPGADKFLSASENRIFALDRLGRLLILDKKTGGRLASMSADDASLSIANQQTDRIYLCSPQGLLQCLHEIGVDEPIQHIQKPTTEKADGETPQIEQKGLEDMGDAPDEDDPKEPADDPFGAADPFE